MLQMQIELIRVSTLDGNRPSFLHAPRIGQKATLQESFAIPYSSSRMIDGLIGVDISIDTFLSAVRNPASIVYARDLGDFDDDGFLCIILNARFAYGVVCSSFANDVLDLPIHRCTHEWSTVPEFFEVTKRTADALALCDTLLTVRPTGRTGGHVRVVTGIARDPQHRVKMVQISEGTAPFSKAHWYAAEEINKMLCPGGKERAFRYRYLDSVTPPQQRIESIQTDLMLNRGALSNYHVGEQVEFNINCAAEALIIESTETRLEIPLDAIEPTKIQGNPYKIYRTSSLAPGCYVAYWMNGTKKNPSVYFNVVRLPEVQLTDDDGATFIHVSLHPVSPDGSPLAKESACLYAEDGTLQTPIVTFAFSDGERLYPARAAVRERHGEIILKPAASLTDADGKRVRSIKIGDDTILYALRARENTLIRPSIKGAECCMPLYDTWTEEGVIAYEQRLLTSDELTQGRVETVVKKYMNDFANFSICCSNEFSRVNTEPITFVLI